MPAALADEASYTVTVGANPPGQSCGEVNGANRLMAPT